jgi:Ca2+-binding EF-hand superfamily protein
MFNTLDLNKDGIIDAKDFTYLEKKTKDELEELGRKLGVELDKRQTKAKLVAAIKKAKKKLKI